MSQMALGVIIGVVPGLICIGLVLVIVRRARAHAASISRRAMTYAADNGLGYLHEDDSWAERFRGHPFPFDALPGRRAINVVTGGPESATFIYWQRNGRYVNQYVVAAVALGPAATSLPTIVARPISALGRMLRRHRLLVGCAEFDRVFAVECDNPAYARALIRPELARVLAGRFHRMSWHVAGGWLIVACPLHRGKDLFATTTACRDLIEGSIVGSRRSW